MQKTCEVTVATLGSLDHASTEIFFAYLSSQFMHRYQAESIVEQDGRVTLINVPFPKGEKVAVVVIPASEAKEASLDDSWNRLAIESFFRDVDDRDAIYDSY